VPSGGGDGEIGDEGVFSFTGAVGNDGVVTSLAGEFDGVDSFGDGADLIEFNEDGIGNAFVDSAREACGVGDRRDRRRPAEFFLG